MIQVKIKPIEVLEAYVEFNNLVPQGLDHLGLCNVRLIIEPASGVDESGGIRLTLTSENGPPKTVFCSAFRLVSMLNDGRFG